MPFLRHLLLVQGIYFLMTAIWPIVHLESFMIVTGYKTDQWLVQARALLIPYSHHVAELPEKND